jgi:hypothetical protein
MARLKSFPIELSALRATGSLDPCQGHLEAMELQMTGLPLSNDNQLELSRHLAFASQSNTTRLLKQSRGYRTLQD